jgi:hypothetical protein
VADQASRWGRETIMTSPSGGPPRHPSTPGDWNIVAHASRPTAANASLKDAPRARVVTVQFWSAYAALFLISVLIQQSFGAGTTYDGASTFLAAPLLLVLSLTVPAVTLAAVALPGLVIRHIPKLRNWWISHSAIAAAGVLLGIALLGVAYLAGFTESGAMDGTPYSVRIPSWSLLAAGWFVLAFFALHTWLPLRWGQQAVDSTPTNGL